MARSRIPLGLLFFLCLVSLGAVNGCQKGPRRAAVSGMVLVDKVPLMEGAISFVPTEGNEGPETGGEIKDGRYSISVNQGAVVGKNKVVIRGFRNTGRKVPDIMDKTKMVDERAMVVGPEFNVNSTLIREIQDGKNVFDFDLPGIK